MATERPTFKEISEAFEHLDRKVDSCLAQIKDGIDNISQQLTSLGGNKAVNKASDTATTDQIIYAATRQTDHELTKYDNLDLLAGLAEQSFGFFEPGDNNSGVYSSEEGDCRPLIFTDVHCFISQIHVFLYNHPPAPNNEWQVVSLFSGLFTGSAAKWWKTELGEEGRSRLKFAGVQAFLDALRKRFDRYHADSL
ncbi:hypothetical protein GGR53DRAFT_470351 [Hypoxylon sp. FL1150]|nr:hypothetical protein GGR53DRAFT_470351 [Hypoxylon sp. FL1150]